MNPTTQVNKRGSDALSRKVATVLADRTGNPHQILADAAPKIVCHSLPTAPTELA